MFFDLFDKETVTEFCSRAANHTSRRKLPILPGDTAKKARQKMTKIQYGKTSFAELFKAVDNEKDGLARMVILPARKKLPSTVGGKIKPRKIASDIWGNCSQSFFCAHSGIPGYLQEKVIKLG